MLAALSLAGCATAPAPEGCLMPFAPRLSATLRVLTAGLSVLLLGALLPAAPASAAAKPRGIAVPKVFFGTHDGNPLTWPAAPFGSIRLWDTGTTWRDIETSPGVYDFGRLNAQVTAARGHKAEVTLVLGQTPSWAVAPGATVLPGCTAPTASGCARMGAGASSVPNVSAWTAYVQAVARTFSGRIQNVQVWNEPNVSGFWSGSPQQMADLTRATRKALSAVHSSMKVVAPSFPVRSAAQRSWLSSFYAKRAGGAPVASYVDAVAVSPYPLAPGTPEGSMALIKSVRSILKARKVSKPLWNSEINYGLASGGTGAAAGGISTDRQTANVVRTYLLNASAGVGRVFWYSWDSGAIANTVLSSPSGAITAPGRSIAVLQGWLAGSRLQSCTVATRGALKGTYTCTVTAKGNVKRVYWNPTRTVKVTTAKSATYRASMYGKSTRLKGGSKLRVDYRPVLVRSAR